VRIKHYGGFFMKKSKLFLMGLLGVLPVFSLVLTGCPTGTTGDLPTVIEVTVAPATSGVSVGGTDQFTATVNGTNDPDTTVTWSVEGNQVDGTSITDGLLAVAANETASTLTVRATSTFDTSKSGTATVMVYATEGAVLTVSVTPSTPGVAKGGTKQFTASVTGPDSPAQTVTWSVPGGGTGTGITSDGLLTVAAGETAETLTVKATYTVDTTKFGTATVTVYANAGDVPTVSAVTVTPSTTNVGKGATKQFSAEVDGTNSPAQTVTWSVTGGGTGTGITAGGLLIVAANETAPTLTVKATSTVDAAQSGTATVTPVSVEKTLEITNISSALYNQGASGFYVGIFESGTTPELAFYEIGMVAKADAGDSGEISAGPPYTATVPLYAMNNTKWTGSGTYDVYLVLGSGSSTSYYRKTGVSFTLETTTVPAETFLTVTPPATSGNNWWKGKYFGGGNTSVVLTGSTGLFKNGDTETPIPNITTKTSGNVLYGGSTDIGDWMYVYSNGTPFGVVINITMGEPGIWGGFNVAGVNEIIAAITPHGPTFSPQPSTVGMKMPGNISDWFSGEKQQP
jgi:hypothetical protein